MKRALTLAFALFTTSAIATEPATRNRTGATTNVALASYGAAASTNTGGMGQSGAWSSQEGNLGPVKPAVFTDATGVGQETKLDVRLRTNGERLEPAYALADSTLTALTPGDTLKPVAYQSQRFPGGATSTEPRAIGDVTSTTAIDLTHGDVTEQTIASTTETHTLFTGATYDSERRLTQWTDEEGRLVQALDFDSTFRLPTRLKLTHPTAASTALRSLTRELTYDERGRVRRSFDVETGAETITVYDGNNRLLSRLEKGTGNDNPDELTEFEYALTDNALTVTTRCRDAGYETSTTMVDGLVTNSTWKFGVNNAQTAVETYSYDAGRLLSKKDARGVLHEYEYDAGTGVAERVV